MVEQWKDVPGYEGILLASSLGRVAQIRGFDYSGYEAVSVSSVYLGHPVLVSNRAEQDSYIIPIHRIIALTFLGEPPDDLRRDVNHKDGDKHNNSKENLEWCSRSENMKHAWKTGLASNKLKKYTEAQYKRARELWAEGKLGIEEVAAEVGMTRGAACHVIYTSGRGTRRAWQDQA